MKIQSKFSNQVALEDTSSSIGSDFKFENTKKNIKLSEVKNLTVKAKDYDSILEFNKEAVP